MQMPTLSVPTNLREAADYGTPQERRKAAIEIKKIELQFAEDTAVFAEYMESFVTGQRIIPKDAGIKYKEFYGRDYGKSGQLFNEELCNFGFQKPVMEDGKIVGYDLHPNILQYNVGIKEVYSKRISWDLGILKLVRQHRIGEEPEWVAEDRELFELEEVTFNMLDLKKAFRKLSMEHHPDRGGCPIRLELICDAKQRLSTYLRT